MDRILGQDASIDLLLRALASGRVHHAWVFAGPRGVGKFTAAIEFARLLLDPAAGPDLMGRWTADPSSPVSQSIDTRSHPDLHIIRKELALTSDNPSLRTRKLSNIPLDVLREHMIGGKGDADRSYEPVVFHTAKLGHGKVFIIDESELLDVTSQNALLKTLEEPPPQTYIILVTSRPERLLPTIRSRSQLVRFRALTPADMDVWFDRAAADESLVVEPDARPWLADFAEGSPGMALRAHEFDFHRWELTLRPLLGRLDRGGWVAGLGDTMAGLVDEFAQAWVKQHKNASKDAANKDGAAALLALLGSMARRDLASRIADGQDADPSIQRIEALRECEAMLAGNVNLKQALEGLMVAWAAAGDAMVAASR
ncbi:MAG: ATP-binding protein [Phycisphaerales bacterium]